MKITISTMIEEKFMSSENIIPYEPISLLSLAGGIFLTNSVFFIMVIRLANEFGWIPNSKVDPSISLDWISPDFDKSIEAKDNGGIFVYSKENHNIVENPAQDGNYDVAIQKYVNTENAYNIAVSIEKSLPFLSAERKNEIKSVFVTDSSGIERELVHREELRKEYKKPLKEFFSGSNKEAVAKLIEFCKRSGFFIY